MGHLSLLHGWLPWTLQAVAALSLGAVVVRRGRRWASFWLPLAVVVGLAVTGGAQWLMDSSGMAGEPAPVALWLWVFLFGVAMTVLCAGWPRSPWWRRAVSVMAVPLCALSFALTLDGWTGYVPTVQAAWGQATDAQLPDQTDQATVVEMAAHHTVPPRGSLVSVTIPDTVSGFHHRSELVYLPPAWFASTPPPKLPALLMIGGELNTPADWVRTGDAITTVESFAAQHGGAAPVLVFADPGGTFNNDTECVNGPRGNSADHLTKDVLPYVISNYHVSADPANWGVVGWSMGGTCAVDLAVMHPELFSTFEDIAGDFGPNSGTKNETVDRLFAGNAAAWDAFDPATVMTRHGPYAELSGWFDVNGDAAAVQPTTHQPGEQMLAANALCNVGQSVRIDCAVEVQPGKHDWPFASAAFAAALPWLAGQIGSPGAPATPIPGASAPE